MRRLLSVFFLLVMLLAGVMPALASSAPPLTGARPSAAKATPSPIGDRPGATKATPPPSGARPPSARVTRPLPANSARPPAPTQAELLSQAPRKPGEPAGGTLTAKPTKPLTNAEAAQQFPGGKAAAPRNAATQPPPAPNQAALLQQAPRKTGQPARSAATSKPTHQLTGAEAAKLAAGNASGRRALLPPSAVRSSNGAVQQNPRGKLLGATRIGGRGKPAAGNTSTPLLSYHNGPVMHTNANYLIFWEPSGTTVSANYNALIEQYMTDVAAASGATNDVYSTDVQYYDNTNGFIVYQSQYVTALVDTNAFPANGCTPYTDLDGQVVNACLTDAQVQTEIARVMGVEGWSGSGANEFFLFTPQDVGECFAADCSTGAAIASGGYCAYHSDFSGTIYAYMPYVGGESGSSGYCDNGNHPNGDNADATINVLSHEANESITDPFGTAWWDNNTGEEDGDICAWNFGTSLGSTAFGTYNQVINGDFYSLQGEWSNNGSQCDWSYSGGSGTMAAPTSLSASALSASSIGFSWQESGSANGFWVFRWNPAGFWAQIADTGAMSFADTGLTPNTTYYYTACAYNSSTDLCAAGYTSATTPSSATAPTNLSATANSDVATSFSWQGGGDAVGFWVYRWNGSSWQFLASANGSPYLDSGLTPNTAYYYTVCAYDNNGAACTSSYASVVTNSYPVQPSYIAAYAYSSSQIITYWDNSAGDATQYGLYRWNGSSWQILATTPGSANYYYDNGLTSSTTYYYYVCAFNILGNANCTANYTYATTYAVAAPTSLAATAQSDVAAQFTWSESGIPFGYYVYRWNGSSWQYAGSAGAYQFFYNDSILAPNTTYYYTVCAYDSGSTACAPGYATVVTNYYPVMPINSAATALSASSIYVTWVDNGQDAAYYNVYRWNGSAWQVLATPNVPAYTDSGLGVSTYYYWVCADNSIGAQTCASGYVSATT